MSLFYGHENNESDESKLSLSGGKMNGAINMNGSEITNVSAPITDYSAINKAYYWYYLRQQTIIYKYLGIDAINTKRLPDYNHGNYRGSEILYSDKYTADTTLYLNCMSFDADSKDYDMKLKCYARIILKDKTISDHAINSGIELRSRPNYDVTMNDMDIRFVDLGIKVRLSTFTPAPEDIRVILVLAEQLSGNLGGQEFTIQCVIGNE